MPPVYPRPYGRGISRAAPRMFFWKKRAPPRTHITVAIHPPQCGGILDHTSKMKGMEKLLNQKNPPDETSGRSNEHFLRFESSDLNPLDIHVTASDEFFFQNRVATKRLDFFIKTPLEERRLS